MLIDFRERGREGGRKISIISHTHPDWGLNLQPRHAPWPGLKPATFQFTGHHSNQPSHTSQGISSTFKSWNTATGRMAKPVLFCLGLSWFLNCESHATGNPNPRQSGTAGHLVKAENWYLQDSRRSNDLTFRMCPFQGRLLSLQVLIG